MKIKDQILASPCEKGTHYTGKQQRFWRASVSTQSRTTIAVHSRDHEELADKQKYLWSS